MTEIVNFACTQPTLTPTVHTYSSRKARQSIHWGLTISFFFSASQCNTCTTSPMTQLTSHTLRNLLKSLSDIDKAWTTASMTGATHIQAISNALLSFSEVTLRSSATRLAIGQLSTMHTSATESLQWLRATLTRLNTALRGAQQTEETIRQFTAHEPVLHLSEYNHTMLLITSWASFMDDIIAGLQRDLDAKRAVVRILQQTIVSGHVKQAELEMCVATWLEQPDRLPGRANILLAAFEAERAAMKADLSSELSPKRRKSEGSVRNVEKVESPAVAILRLSGKKRQG